MANEAVIIELCGQPKGRPLTFSVVDATRIEKGALCALYDPRSMSGASFNMDGSLPFAGIAAAEKVASDGSTTLAAWTEGVFDLKNGVGTVNVGKLVSLSGANVVYQAAATDVENGYVVGKALEEGAANEIIAVAVGIY